MLETVRSLFGPRFRKSAGAEVAPAAGKVEASFAKPASEAAISFAQLAEELKAYLPPRDVKAVFEAFKVSDSGHLGQVRASGEPYITHPIAVARICAGWRLDVQALQAALLHDVLEDTEVDRALITEKFGATVADLVDGLSKLDRLEFTTREQQQAESFRKMLLAMSRDIRVILVKLADRLHNMRTLGAMAGEKRRRIAHETMDIYAPIAHRLGLNQVYRELQDMSFANMFPMRHDVLEKAVAANRRNRRELVGKVLTSVEEALKKSGLPVEVHGREKTLYGIYRKMVSKHLSFSQVLDIYGFRVVVENDAQCYLALGAIHALYKPVPAKFKDYIAIPKLNGYQSLHTTVRGPYGTPLEFQIRTRDMHRIAESGVAAHWLYKTSGGDLSEVQRQTMAWMQSLLDIQSQTGDSSEFIENVKIDLFPDSVYVFTPMGKIVALPRGATALDLAYAVHTAIGNTAIGARINGEDAPLRFELRSGDVVEITTSEGSRPNPAWLTFVRTGRARSEIRHALKSANRDEAAALGERLVNQTLNSLGVAPAQLTAEAWQRTLSDTGNKVPKDLYAEVGQGKRLPAAVVALLLRGIEGNEQAGIPGAQLTISGAEGAAVQFAACCMPIPGDGIMAVLGKGHGLLVHSADCQVAQRQRQRDPERWIDVAWAENPERSFPARVKIHVHEGKGVLAKVASAIAENSANILRVNNEEEPGKSSTMDLVIEVESRPHLAQVFRSLRRIQAVLRVQRHRAGEQSTE
jgi:GTP pyrophosphokinase